MPCLKNARHEAFAQGLAKGLNADSCERNRYYVYELFDPRTSAAFYVGKGCGHRDKSHIGEARRGEFKNPAKIAMIRSLEAEGVSIGIRRITENLTEREAYRIERERIAHYGFANLTNAVRGQQTDDDKAEAMAIDGMRIMASHLSAILSGDASYSASEASIIFRLIGELKQVLELTRVSTKKGTSIWPLSARSRSASFQST